MDNDGGAPTFGLWYDFRQKLPLGDYARFYAECLEEIEEAECSGLHGGLALRAPLRGRRVPALAAGSGGSDRGEDHGP